ncbi:MAG: hypothetical protein EHM79_12420 [Geobacter sp.]|nr:MAG: hypothetical protein EHM79_12420 [Geobacter sp.]
MEKRLPLRTLATTSILFCLTLCQLFSADPSCAQYAEKSARNTKSSIRLVATPLYQFEANLGSDGNVSAFRTFFDINSTIPLDEPLSIGLNFGYHHADYNFADPVTFAGGKPWDKVHILKFGASVRYDLTPEWSLLVAPSVQISCEDGASWGNAIGFGGVFSLTRDFSPDLSLGLGVAAFDQLEELSAFPIIAVNWRITDRLRLANPFRPGPAGPAGLELSYKIGNGWDLAAGAAYRSERFRLKNSGLFSNGIGESSLIPAWARISKSAGSNFHFDFYAGAMLGGVVSIDDRDGNRITSDNYDPAPFLAFAISSRF